MPAAPGNPSPAGFASPSTGASKGAAAPAMATAGSRGKLPVLAIAGGAGALILVVGVLAFALGKKQPAPAASAAPVVVAAPPTPAPAAPAPVATTPAVVPASDNASSTSVAALEMAPGSYKIVNRLTGLCLDVSTNTGSNGSNVLKAVLRLYNGAQIWNVRRCGTNQYSLLSPQGPSLELPVSKQNGAQLELAKWVHVPREVWTMVPTQDGYFEITCAASGGRVAEVLGGTEGEQIVVQDSLHQGSLNQQWSFQAP